MAYYDLLLEDPISNPNKMRIQKRRGSPWFDTDMYDTVSSIFYWALFPLLRFRLNAKPLEDVLVPYLRHKKV